MKKKILKKEFELEDENEITKCNEYEISDGTIIKVKEQSFKVSENLFHPSLYQKNNDGIDKKILILLINLILI